LTIVVSGVNIPISGDIMERTSNISNFSLDTMDQAEYIINWLKNHSSEYQDDFYDDLINKVGSSIENNNDEYVEASYFHALTEIEDLIVNQRILLRDALKWKKQRDIEYASLIIKYFNPNTNKLKIKSDKVNYIIDNNKVKKEYVHPLEDFIKLTNNLYERIINWTREEELLLYFFEEIQDKFSVYSKKVN
jgi:hypothetical protein